MAASPASTSATTVGVPMAPSYGSAYRSYLVAWVTRRASRISRSLPSSARSATRCTNAASFWRGRCTASGRASAAILG
jgi:hypothetical protein